MVIEQSNKPKCQIANVKQDRFVTTAVVDRSLQILSQMAQASRLARGPEMLQAHDNHLYAHLY